MPDLPQMLPLVPNRVYRQYRGGRLLDELQGRPDPQDTNYPEEWIGSTTLAVNPHPVPDEGLSRVRLTDGSTPLLRDLLQRDAKALLGAEHLARYGPQPDFLVKFLDSAVRLSFQAHPSVEFSRRHLKSDRGKTESWVILAARPDNRESYVYLGFQHPPSRDEWTRMVRESDTQAMEACFDKIPVQAGDVFLVPGSTPHAIGPGLLMVEIQEPTDFVVRCEAGPSAEALADPARFMHLGLETAMSMFDYAETPLPEVMRRWRLAPECLAENPAGCIERIIGPAVTDRFAAYRVTAQGAMGVENGCFSICAVVQGRGRVEAGGSSIPVGPGSTFVAAASCERLTMHPQQAGEAGLVMLVARRF